MTKVTIRSIAELCGVSVATVSRAVNGSGYVNAALKRKILNCIEDAGWQTQSLQGRMEKKSDSEIAVVGQLVLLDEPGSAGKLRRIVEAVQNHFQQTPVLYLGHRMENLTRCLKSRPKAVLLLGMTERLEKPVRLLQESGIRVVAHGETEKPICPTVCGDHFEAARRAAEFLKSQGHTRIGFLGGFGAKAHPGTLNSVRPCRVRLALEGVMAALPEFDPARDAVSDCFGDLEAFRNMLYSEEHTAWITFGVENFLFYAEVVRTSGLRPMHDRPAAAILETDSVAVPPLARRIFRIDIARETECLVDLLEGKISAEQCKVPYIEI